jgi:hypothetical protein
MKWISVKDRLPEEKHPIEEHETPGVSVECIVYGTVCGRHWGRYYHKSRRWQVDWCHGDMGVTHWMEAPAPPPKEGK